MSGLSYLLYFLVIVPSAIIHEYAHGWMADRLGDSTARYAGRLTLNPKAHIDLWGTILMPVVLLFLSGGNFLFGYAKPVPYNPYNLKNQRWGPALVSVVGPLANLMLGICFALLIRFELYNNFTLATFYYLIARVNILLFVFNLVPVPPLDGSKILYAVLPDSLYRFKEFLERNSLILLFVFIFFLFGVISPIVDFIMMFLIGNGV